MAKDLGWIKLHRSSFNNRLYFSEPFTRWQAWADLLLIANHCEGWVRVRGIKQTILRGQVGYSMTYLAKRYMWSKGKIIRYLNELRDEHQVVLQKTNVTTIISIVNYNRYQTDEFANSIANDTANSIANDTANGFANSTLTRIIKNDNKIINKYTPDALSPPENCFYPNAKNYNGLPKHIGENVFRLVKTTKNIELENEDINTLWEVFKEQNLTGEKPYKDENDFYRHFQNWANKQSFRKKTKPRELLTKNLKNGSVVGIEFINDFSEVKMSDGSTQFLTTNQTDSARFNQINPKSIKKV